MFVKGCATVTEFSSIETVPDLINEKTIEALVDSKTDCMVMARDTCKNLSANLGRSRMNVFLRDVGWFILFFCVREWTTGRVG